MIRIFDFLLSLIALFLLSPIFLIVILVLRLTGEGKVFYYQKRIGKGKKIITLYKFATMISGSEKTGTITVKNDPRILPFGAFLRDTKINELVQLVNIIKGDMSLIGPRPQTKESFELFDRDTQNIIGSLKPGLSGLGSIVFSNEEAMLENEIDPKDFYRKFIAPFKGKLEIWYSNNINTKIYFALIFLTLVAVLFKKNGIPYRFFNSLPEVPENLRKFITN
tara:strand:+ start:116 stop:781 length:666 start_codon:yes stop_codon:yes gene_type:complete